ncbi:MAG TPA: aspartate kinase [Candidatus Dormibacteraeota bacterium]|nr:aspartate kinase [Candidatus Dormibacteraeota bacterium]
MSLPIQVMKFGGTSVGNAERIRSAAAIAAEASKDHAVVVVVSAMSGVTNTLIAAAGKATAGDEATASALATALQTKHHEVIGDLITDIERRRELLAEIDALIETAANYCRGCALLGELSPRALDVIAGTGERLNARITAAVLREMGCRGVAFDATDLIVTDDVHGGARPLTVPTRTRTQAALLPLLEAGGIPVVTGYIAATAKGVPTTLGRGGSDFSATILGSALDAGDVVIWTDVNGVLTADPRMVPDAITLDEVSYIEAGELAFFGAKVLHPMTLRPVIESGIPVWIRNSFQPQQPGTKITHSVSPAPQGVKAVTATRDVAMIAVAGPGIIGVPDIAARIFGATASVRANIVMISQSSSQDSICFVVQAGDAARTEKALRDALYVDVHQHDLEHIKVNRNVAIVAAVGENMCGTPGIAGRVFSILGQEAINIIAIAQGSSEYNISFLVESSGMEKAVKALHEAFDLGHQEQHNNTRTVSQPTS